MKKLFALIIALLMLTACGAEAEPAEQTQPKATTPVATVPAETEPEPTMSPEGYFVEEITKDNGTKVIRHRLNSIKGKVIWSRTENPNGTFEEKTNNQDGKLISEKFSDTDGVIYEKEYYDYGALRIALTQFPDGSSSEIHYDADGYSDGRVNHPGTVVYKKNVAADGQITEEGWPLSKIIYELDGSWWEVLESSHGIIYRTHYSEDGHRLERTTESTTEGWKAQWELYESGADKKMTRTYADSTYECMEFYEDGRRKTFIYNGADGSMWEERYNEQGYYTYDYYKDQHTEVAYFAGENNELVKYIENGTTYEGADIPVEISDAFKQMQERTQQAD